MSHTEVLPTDDDDGGDDGDDSNDDNRTVEIHTCLWII